MFLNRKSLILVLCIVAILALISFYFFSQTSSIGQQEPPDNIGKSSFKIGAVLPLTGDAATFGHNASLGAELALEHLQSVTGTSFKFIAEDSRGNAEGAVEAVLKLINFDHVDAIVGGVTSTSTHAIIPHITKNKIPTISPSASDPRLSGASDYFSRVWPSDVYEASVIAAFSERKGFKRLAVLYADTDYGAGMINEFKVNFPKERVLFTIPFERGLPDFRPTIARLRQNNVEAIFVVLYPEDGKRLFLQMREADFQIPIIGTATLEDPTIIESSGKLKVYFASPLPLDPSSSIRKEFNTSYEKRFGEKPGTLSDMGYDAASLLGKALISAHGDSQATASTVRKTNHYQGVSGLLSIDDQGDVHKSFGIKTIKQGAFVWLEGAQ